MSAQAEASAELFRQLAFISALIGGFSLTFLAQLLLAHPERRVVGWTAGFAVGATAGLMVCALGWTLGAAVAAALDPAVQAEGARWSLSLTRLHLRLSLAFAVSLLLFLVSLGLCGWIRSRAMGIVTSATALAAAVATLLILRLFVHVN